MIINLIAIGKIKEEFFQKAIKEYLKRLSGYCKINIKEIDGLKSKSSMEIDKIKAKEAEKILEQVSEGSFVIALDQRGKHLNNYELAAFIKDSIINTGVQQLDIIIGGAFGLDENVIQRSNSLISLSKLTFTHQMVRIILLEQLYRTFKILNNEPYHK